MLKSHDLPIAISIRITQENKLGQRFIGASDFLKNGIPASILALLMIISVGYATSNAIG